MPKYVVRWSEVSHYESEVTADSPEEAEYLCLSNLGDYQDVDDLGIEQESIVVEEVNA